VGRATVLSLPDITASDKRTAGGVANTKHIMQAKNKKPRKNEAFE
jgi:hypothetical protein